MAVVYNTIVAPCAPFRPDVGTFASALGALLKHELLLEPAVLLRGGDEHFPLFHNYLDPDGLEQEAAALVATLEDEETLEEAVARYYGLGDSVALWFRSLNWANEWVAIDLEITEEAALALECTVALVFAQQGVDPGISSPYYGTPYKPFFGEVRQYLELSGTHAPIDEEVRLSMVARVLGEVWGELKAGTSMVSR